MGEPHDGMQTVTKESNCITNMQRNLTEGGGEERCRQSNSGNEHRLEDYKRNCT